MLLLSGQHIELMAHQLQLQPGLRGAALRGELGGILKRRVQRDPGQPLTGGHDVKEDRIARHA